MQDDQKRQTSRVLAQMPGPGQGFVIRAALRRYAYSSASSRAMRDHSSRRRSSPRTL